MFDVAFHSTSNVELTVHQALTIVTLGSVAAPVSAETSTTFVAVFKLFIKCF